MTGKIGFIFLYIFFPLILTAQQNATMATVIATKLNLRANPSLTAPVVGQLRFGEKVRHIHQASQTQQIVEYEGVKGYWMKVIYREKEAFAFSGYLSFHSLIKENPATGINTDFRIMSASGGCGDIAYRPDWHWYGIFQTEKGDSLLEVDIEIYADASSDKEHEVKISMNRHQAYLLIGSKTPLQECYLGNILANKDGNFPSPLGFLYPGQRRDVWVSSQSGHSLTKTLYATGAVHTIGYCPEFENYQLFLCEDKKGKIPHDSCQELMQEFSFTGECNMVSPDWHGDLDGDQELDLIFLAASNSGAEYSLFLSSAAKNGEQVKKVAIFSIDNCY